jgi:hypothetical protein
MQTRMRVILTFAGYLQGSVRETPTCRVSPKFGMTGTKPLNGRFYIF